MSREDHVRFCEKLGVKFLRFTRLFKTSTGAAIADVIMSMSAPAHLAGINIFDYFMDILRYSKYLKAGPDSWLPWNYEATVKSLNPQKAAR